MLRTRMRYDVHMCNFELYECGWILACVQQPRPQGFSLKNGFLREKPWDEVVCTDVPPPSEKNGRRDVFEWPTIIVFPFPWNVGDSL